MTTTESTMNYTKIHVAEYRGFNIELECRGHNAWKFRVLGDDFPIAFPSLEAAKQAIDKQISDDAKMEIEKAKIEVAIDVLDEDGKAMTIVGLHRGNGRALVKGREPYEGYVYPVVPWVADTLQRMKVVREELDYLNEKLRSIDRVSLSKGWRSRILPEDYASRIKRLRNELKVAEAAARKTKWGA